MSSVTAFRRLAAEQTKRTSTANGCLLATIFGLVSFGLLLLFLGGCHEYVLWSAFGKNVPWYSDMIAGFFMSPITVPGTFVCWAYRIGGMATPFFG